MNTQRKTITVDELREQLGIGRGSTYQMLKDGRIPGAMRIARDWIIPADAVDRMFQQVMNGGSNAAA